MHGGWQIGNQPLEKVIDGELRDTIEVVQHKRQTGVERLQVMDQGGDQNGQRRQGMSGEQGQDGLTEGGMDPLNGSDDVAEEGEEVVVTFVEGEPGAGELELLQPLADEGALAITRRSANENELACQPLVQPFD